MEKNRIFLCVLFLGLFFMSCNKDKIIYADATLVDYDDFKEVVELKAETIAGFDGFGTNAFVCL